MLNYTSIRNLYKSADRIDSEHVVVAEWNMNKYNSISQYGLYKGSPNTLTASYNSSDSNIIGGENYLIYDDGTKRVATGQNIFSDLSSVFKPERPDRNIIILQKFGSMTVAPVFSNIKVGRISTASARYYPYSETRSYDYFNSAKVLDKNENSPGMSGAVYGISDSNTGAIANVSPFVVYDNKIKVSKLTFKVQTHLCVPQRFKIDVLVNNVWQEAYGFNSSSSADFSSGTFNLYFKNNQWSKTESKVSDINQFDSVSPTELKEIQGIRLAVSHLTKVVGRNNSFSPGSLELIEISPRLEMDLTAYTESFSFNGSIGDSTEFGLPVGSLVSSTGTISLSNEEQNFLFSSSLSKQKMLNQDVKFSFFQKVYVSSENQTFIIPLKVMYSRDWSVGEDYSVTSSLEDGFKFLQETNAPDLLFSSSTPMSNIILMILDNAGITGLEFKKSSNAIQYDKEDTLIKNFFCKKEQTVAEVLQEIAVATQACMFYDAVGRLNVLTKEKLTEDASIQASDGGGGSKTDFWFVSDENVNSSDPEYTHINNYTANVISLSEERIKPITDGEIVYHSYGPKKVPLSNTLENNNAKVLNQLQLDQFPMNSLAFANFGYGTTILWSPSQDNTSVLGAANITRDIPNKKLQTLFTASYTAYDENQAISDIYLSTQNPILFPTQAQRDEARRSLVIYIDVNEGLTIPAYEGTVLIDSEYIKFRGKLFYIASTTPSKSGYKLIFSEEEFSQLLVDVNKGDTIVFRGLLVDVRLNIIGKNDDKYIYKVIGDGRGKLGSSISPHFAVAEDSDGIEDSQKFKLILGESKRHSVPGNLTTTTKFNFLEKTSFSSARSVLGTLPDESLETYLGFLKLSGPTSPRQDLDVVDSIVSGKNPKSARTLLRELNKQVDEATPGDFDDYVYMQGERAVYGQKIDLGFAPNVISTRMRLYSPRRRIKNQRDIMSTNSSIAGIGFGINNDNEGYFLEVESAGAGKDIGGEKEAFLNNLRFYKIFLNKEGKYEPKLLMRASVGAYATFDSSVQITKDGSIPTDPVFELDIYIEQYDNAMRYAIKYGDTTIGTYTEPIGQAIGVNSSRVFIFVRNDSQALYEYIAAAARPNGRVNRKYWRSYKKFSNMLREGIIPVNKSFFFRNNEIKFYFNDFARLAREVKEYDIRFSAPAYVSALLDISEINPDYLIKKYKATAFGAKLTVVNTSFGAIALGEDTNIPLYIVGIGLEELNSGTVSMKDVYDLINDDKKRVTDREKNIAIYGSQTFTLDSQYIQSLSHARNIMKWLIKYSSRERIKMTMEIFPNPLLELGDKVKVFDKSRGYNQSNENFGSKTFVVSSIDHSVNSSGPAMTIGLIEVGEG